MSKLDYDNSPLREEIDDLKARIAEQDREIARLREALKAIESGDLYHPEKSARRALLGGGENG